MRHRRVKHSAAVIGAAVVLSFCSLTPPVALARGGHFGGGHFGGGHFGGGHWGGRGFGWGGVGLGLAAGAVAASACLQRTVTYTPAGPVVSWINVCY